MRAVGRLPEDGAFVYAERELAELYASEEVEEGIAPFFEKRPPRWAPGKDGH